MKHPLMLAAIAALAGQCLPANANPTDNGTPGYTSRIYVDSAQTCHLASNGSNPFSCGNGPTNAFQNLREALSTVNAGTEVIVAGYAPSATDGTTAYYNDDKGIAVQQADGNYYSQQQFLTLPLLENNASTAKVKIRGWSGMAAPRVRGTMRFNGSAWQSLGNNLYAMSWKIRGTGAAICTAKNQANQCIAYSYPIVGPQQMFRGDVPIQQVGGTVYLVNPESGSGPTWLSRSATRKVGRVTPASGTTPWLSLAANQFYYDGTNASNPTLYVKTATALSANEALEVSVQQFLLSTTNVKNVTINDLIFERSNGSAYSAQNSAVTINGNGNVLDTVVVQSADAICLLLQGTNQKVLNSKIQQCGQMGIAATGVGHVISGNKVLYNNAKGFDENWAGAGIKLIGELNVPINNITISNNTVSYNSGHGIWLDTTPEIITITGNTVSFNGAYNSKTDGTFYAQRSGTGGIGLFIEVSNGNQITNNSVIGNINQGMQLKGVCNKVMGNVFVGNWQPGLVQLADGRVNVNGGTCAQGTATYSNTISSNYLYWNEETGSTGGVAIGLLPTNAAVSSNMYCGIPNHPLYVYVNTPYYTLADWKAAAPQNDVGATAKTGAYIAGNLINPKPGDYIVNDIGWATATARGEQGVTSLATYLNGFCN